MSWTYVFVDAIGREYRSNFEFEAEAALQAKTDLDRGRAVSVQVFDTTALPDPGMHEPPPVTDTPSFEASASIDVPDIPIPEEA